MDYKTKKTTKIDEISTLDLTFTNLIRWFGKCRSSRFEYYLIFTLIFLQIHCTNLRRKKTFYQIINKISFLSLEWLKIDTYSLHNIWYSNFKFGIYQIAEWDGLDSNRAGRSKFAPMILIFSIFSWIDSIHLKY